MERVKVSPKGQIAIPKQVREALNLKVGSKLILEIRGQEIVLSRDATWRSLQGAGGNLMNVFAAFKKEERERENSRP